MRFRDNANAHSAHLYQVFIKKLVFVKRFLRMKPDSIFLSGRCGAGHRTELKKKRVSNSKIVLQKIVFLDFHQNCVLFALNIQDLSEKNI